MKFQRIESKVFGVTDVEMEASRKTSSQVNGNVIIVNSLLAMKLTKIISNNHILIDSGKNVLHTIFKSWGNMINTKPLKLRLSGFNTKRCPADNRDFSGFFVACLALSGLNWLGDINRQGMLNNRGFSPRGGWLTDYIREFVTWVMRLQANYRTEQPVLRNVVLIGRLGRKLKGAVKNGIKG